MRRFDNGATSSNSGTSREGHNELRAGREDDVDKGSLASPSTNRSGRARVSMACIHCRQRKIRCDGAQPVCSTCIRLGRNCVYESVSELENTQTRERKRRSKEAKQARLAALAGLGILEEPSHQSFQPSSQQQVGPVREPARTARQERAKPYPLNRSPNSYPSSSAGHHRYEQELSQQQQQLQAYQQYHQHSSATSSFPNFPGHELAGVGIHQRRRGATFGGHEQQATSNDTFYPSTRHEASGSGSTSQSDFKLTSLSQPTTPETAYQMHASHLSHDLLRNVSESPTELSFAGLPAWVGSEKEDQLPRQPPPPPQPQLQQQQQQQQQEWLQGLEDLTYFAPRAQNLATYLHSPEAVSSTTTLHATSYPTTTTTTASSTTPAMTPSRRDAPLPAVPTSTSASTATFSSTLRGNQASRPTSSSRTSISRSPGASTLLGETLALASRRRSSFDTADILRRTSLTDSAVAAFFDKVVDREGFLGAYGEEQLSTWMRQQQHLLLLQQQGLQHRQEPGAAASSEAATGVADQHQLAQPPPTSSMQPPPSARRMALVDPFSDTGRRNSSPGLPTTSLETQPLAHGGSSTSSASSSSSGLHSLIQQQRQPSQQTGDLYLASLPTYQSYRGAPSTVTPLSAASSSGHSSRHISPSFGPSSSQQPPFQLQQQGLGSGSSDWGGGQLGSQREGQAFFIEPMAPPPPPKGSVGDEEARAHPSTSPQPAWRPSILTPMTELSSHFFDMGRPSNPLPGGIVSAEPGATAERTSGPSPGPSSSSWGTQPEPNSLDKIFEHQSEQQQPQQQQPQQPRENPRGQKGSESDKPHWWQA